MNMRLGVLASHPIQYQAPLFRQLALRSDLRVFYAHRQTAEAQAAAGYGVAFDWDVDLLSGYPHTFLSNVARRPSTSRFFGCDTPKIELQIRSGEFDAFLVMGWHLKSFWQAIRACRREGVPVMVRGDSQLSTPRSLVKRAAKELLYPLLLRQFDACLYVGQRNREYLEHYGVPSERLFFAPHCVDAEAFARSASAVDREKVRASWGLAPTDKALLFVGRMVPQKRASDLIEAATYLRKGGHNVTAVFAGDGVERANLERLASDYDLPTKFLGFCNQNQLAAVYGAADVLVLPSNATETWGLVVNEALACGTPCVVSDRCGCSPDMALPGISGAVFPYGNIPEMARALVEGLSIPRRSPAIDELSRRHSSPAAAAGVISAFEALRLKQQ